MMGTFGGGGVVLSAVIDWFGVTTGSASVSLVAAISVCSIGYCCSSFCRDCLDGALKPFLVF